MAAAGMAFGREAIFLVVPVCGGLLVALTYAVGRCVGDRLAGLVSASLLASSPAFLQHLLQPMSDVPASAAWAAAVVSGLRGSGAWPALGSALPSRSPFSSARISHPSRARSLSWCSCAPAHAASEALPRLPPGSCPGP